MSKSFSFWGLSILAVATLAGCVGDSVATGEIARATEALRDDMGGVQGQVITDELQPIANAQVGIAALPAVATTTEDGAYRLVNIPPGKHVVAVIALGYESQSVSVDVVAGQFVDAQFLLSPLPSLGPYHTTGIHKLLMSGQMLKATPDCMYPIPGQATIKTCVGGASCVPNECEMAYGHCGESGSRWAKYGCDFGLGWKTILGEVAWQPQSTLTGRGFLHEILAPNVTRSGTGGHSGSVDQSDVRDFWTLNSKSPIRIWVDQEAMDARKIKEEDRCGGINIELPKCDWHWRLFPAWCTIHGVTGGAWGCDKFGSDFGIMQDQPAMVYFTYFMHEPAPAGWTALPDS